MASSNNDTSINNNVNGYVKVNRVHLENEQLVEEYFSLHSGMRVILSNNVKSPKVYGYFTLITEVENSEGLPHTLEHLIFLGSRKYPYKGLLDFLSFKCLSEGTNAWTAIDHTCYTIETVGIEGFCTILPVYLDAILNPTLEDDFFLSEVHHIYEEGEHSGVVYSEMKSVENECSHITARAVYRSLYPNEKCPYRFEAGGTLEGLRTTSNDRVKEYFKRFYKLDNFVAIVFGNFENDLILNVIREFEKYHLHVNPNQRRKEAIAGITLTNMEIAMNEFLKHLKNSEKPWRKPEYFEKTTQSTVLKKYYPSNKLDNGQVTIAWRGCKWNDFKTKLALNLMGIYLTDSTTSPLGKVLLESERCYCAEVVYDQEDFGEILFTIDVFDVPYKGPEWKVAMANGLKDKEKTQNTNEEKKNDTKAEIAIEVVGNIVRKCLEKVYKEPLSMLRLKGILHRIYYQHLKNIEQCPHYTLIDYLLKYCIYGQNATDLKNNIDIRKFYLELVEETESYWKQILKTYFIENEYVEVKCYPSLKKAKQIESFEKNLKEEEQKRYGKEELQKLVENIKKIIENKKQLPPPEVFDVIPYADPKKVVIPPVLFFRNFEDKNTHILSKQTQNPLKNYSDKKIKEKTLHLLEEQICEIKFPLQLNHIKSLMATINVYINTDKINDDLKRFLPLLSSLIYESDVIVNGKVLRHEDYMLHILRYTVSHGNDVGINGNVNKFRTGLFANVFYIGIRGLLVYYDTLFDLIFLTMFNINVSLKKLKQVMKSSYQHLLKHKTMPKTLLYNLHYFLRYLKNGNTSFISLGKQESVLKMKESEYDFILEKINELRKILFDPSNFFISIDANFEVKKDFFTWYNRWFSQDEDGKFKINDPHISFTDESNTQDTNFADDTDFTTDLSITSISADEIKNERNRSDHLSNDKLRDEEINDICNSSFNKESSDTNNIYSKINTSSVYISCGKRIHKPLNVHFGIRHECEDKNFKEQVIKNVAYNGIICETPSTDVSYLLLTIKVPTGKEQPDYPELRVLSEYLSMCEGPLYRSVRGAGYAYGVQCSFNSLMGEFTLYIFAANDVIGALKESFNVMKSICANKLTEDQLLLAKYITYYTIFDKQETVSDLLMQSVLLNLLNVDLNYNAELLNKVSNVTVDSFHKVLSKYLAKFLQFKIDEKNAYSGSTLCIICGAGKMNKIAEALREELKIGNVLCLNTSQLYRLFRTYDLESILKEKEKKKENTIEEEEEEEEIEEETETEKEEKKSQEVKENWKKKASEEGNDEETHVLYDEYEDEEEYEDTSDSEDTSGASVNISDDSYPGYSDN